MDAPEPQKDARRRRRGTRLAVGIAATEMTALAEYGRLGLVLIAVAVLLALMPNLVGGLTRLCRLPRRERDASRSR